MASASFLQKAYLAYFGRPVDPTGLTDYAASTETQVADAFAASAESKALYGTTFNYAQINAIYQALFNRDAEKAGLEYWYAKVADKTYTAAGAAIAILNGAQNADKVAIDNKLAASAAFSAALDTAPEMIGYSGDAAAASARAFLSSVTTTAATAAAVDAAVAAAVAAKTAVAGQTFTLTTGVDTPSSTNLADQYNATGTTFSAGDIVDGGNGNDTLTIVDTVGVLNAARVSATVTNIENMEIQTAGRLGQVTSTGTKQVNTYTMPASVANVAQSNQYTFATDSTTNGSINFTYGGSSGSFATAATTAATTATNFAAAVNTTAGSTVAYTGKATLTVAADAVAGDTSISLADISGLAVGMGLVCSTSADLTAGTTITSITAGTGTAGVIGISKAIPATKTITAGTETVTAGGGTAGVTVVSPVAGTASPSIAFTSVASGSVVISDITQALVVANTKGNVGDTVSFTYNGLQGSYVIGSSATTTGGNFVTALNAVAGYTAAVNTAGSVAVTAATAGTALPTIAFSGATGNIPSGTNTTANGLAATTGTNYDVSGISLTNFKASATDVIAVKAKATTALDLTGTGAVTVTGGGGASTVTSSAAAVSIGANDTTVANGFTSVTVKGTSTTVDVTDNSGLAANGTTVAVGSTLTKVSVTGNTGLATITGKAVTDVSMIRSAGGLTVTNANDHALTLGLTGVTAGTVTDNTATSIAITTNASTAASTGVALTGLTASKAASITVAGTKKVDLGTISATKLDTLTITGTGGVTANVSSVGATSTNGYVTTVDTTGSTAVLSATAGTNANTITIGTSTVFTGGAGQDNVTVAATTKALTLGGGDDVLTLNGVAALGTGGTIDGGAGNDTLVMDVTNAATAGSSSGTLNAKISNFEILSLAADTVANGGESIDLAYLTGLNTYVKIAAMDSHSNDALTLTNFASGGTIELTGDNGVAASGADYIITVKDAGSNLADVLNIKLTSDNAVRAADNITAVGVETVNIITNNLATNLTPASTTDTISLSGSTGLKYVNVTGNAGLTLTTTDASILSVNASGITGTTAQPNAFSWTSGAITNTAHTNLVVIGTNAGANTINLNSITDTLQTSTITGGTGTGINTITGGAGADIATGGAGADVFSMGGGRDTITTGAGIDKITFDASAVNRDTVTDFTAGAGGQGDTIVASGYAGTTEYKAWTAAAAAFTWTGTHSTGNILEFAFAANTGKNLGDSSADSLTGVNLLKALNDGETAASITLTTTVDTDVAYVVAYQGGNAYIYAMGSSAADTNLITGNELALVGILQNVAVGAITLDNFVAS